MKCGESDNRNLEFEKNFNIEDYFKSLIITNKPTIFDVGAHHGESIDFFKNIWPNSLIHAFEPDPNSCSSISKHFSNVFINNIGLSDVNGKLPFYKQTITHLNSLIKIKSDSMDSLGYAKEAENFKIDVNVSRGDDYMKGNNIEKIDLLKIDVQGNEINVLKGFRNCLNLIDVIIVEISFYDFYETKNSFFDLEQVIRNRFELWDILKLSKNPKNYRTDWAELVYKKKD
jgi:FkbM family methyltransferase